MNAQPDLIHIPLDQLQLSPRNARKTVGAGVEDLAASIAAHGLLQNLTVQPSANGDTFGVVAGGRRLAALHLLAQRGEIPDDHPLRRDGIPCRVIHDDDVALEASTAENTLREAMHPADQFDAFRAMVDAGKPLPDVAAHFGVPDLVVKQRLKLANVNPALVEIYRQGGMSLEQLQALALTDNHEAQRQAWFTATEDWDRTPRSLRERITQREIESDSVLAKFVGLPAYEAAGGQVRRDLFSARGECWLQDQALLKKLALEQLEALAQAERDAGWSWAEAHLALDYARIAEYPRYPAAKDTTFTTDQQKRLDVIEERLTELELIDVDTLSDDDFQAELQRLEAERDEIHAAAQDNLPVEVRAASGVLVYLDFSGLVIDRGRLQPGQKVDTSGTVSGTPKPSTAAGGTDAKPKKAELSAAVLTTLSAHRSEVARHHVARDPQLALALLVDWYVARIQLDYSDSHLLNLQGTSVPDARKVAPDLHKALDADREALPGQLKQIPRKNRLAWLIQRPQAELLAMLAACVAARFGGITERPEGHEGVAALHAAIGFDMADHWNPSCDNFLTRIPKDLVVEAVEEACKRKGMMDPKACAASVATEKGKDAIAAAAGKFLAGSGWLPKPLRGPGYAVTAPKPAEVKPAPKAKPKASAKPAAKKAAAKKPAKKAPAKKKTRRA
jgi:ParB family chromosome partitioning protein